MSLKVSHKNVDFGVGDKVKVTQKIKDGGKERTQIFEGMIIAFKNRSEGRTFTVRKIGAQGIGVERIFPLNSPFLEKVEVIKKGTSGVRRSKLYYTRKKSPSQIEEIFTKAQTRQKHKSSKKK